jgi:hypothetical protein
MDCCAHAGLTVTIKGGGFDSSRNYTCAVPGSNSSSVRSVNSTHIVCALPPYSQVEMRVGLRVFETVSSAFLAGAAPFTFIEGISFLNQSAGPASGGTYVRVHGVGFNASLQYTLIFSHVRNGVKNSATSPPAVFVSRTLLNVSAPRWSFPFANVDVTLAINGVPKPLSGSVKFQYVEIVTALLPPSGLVFGTFISFRLYFRISCAWRYIYAYAHALVLTLSSALLHTSLTHMRIMVCVTLA